MFAMKAFGIVEPGTKYEDNWHVAVICKFLEATYRGEIKRLLINLPPRTLKSYLVARAFPAWVMGKSPSTKFISTSYGYEVSEQNAIACRRIMKDPWYMSCFPATRIGDMDRNTHFETTEFGQYYAASALSPLTGLGCDYFLADDLLKPMEAASETIRNSTNENMRNTFFSRFNDKRTGRFIMVMQRLHEDDPTGNLLKDGGWVHLKLPAEAMEDIIIELNGETWTMKKGDLLFPARLSKEILAQTRLDMTEATYVGQYLQDPVPMGGGEFKEEFLQYYAQGSVKPKEMNLIGLMDQAGGDSLNQKKKKNSDWTVIQIWGLAADNNYYLLDMIRDRLNPTERVETLFLIHRKWNELSGKSFKFGVEKYGLMSDDHYIKEKQRQDAYHFQVVPLGGNTMKEERIRRLIPPMQNGRVYVPHTLMYIDNEGRKFDLIEEMKSEMKTFPRSRFDDCLDTASRLFEPELYLAFPQLKSTMVQKAIRNASNSSGPSSWMDF